jgi:[CysO sulfur-carrier protein]-S-L-cysteine hydrolase
MIDIETAALAAMRGHAVEGFPEEVCGVLFASPGGQVVRRMTNVQNALHAADPVANPRDARTAYQFDAGELLDVTRQGDEPGWRIVLFYHSHPEHGAYFSDTDKARALFGGEVELGPAFPGVAYLVISVYDRVVRDWKTFAWDEAAQDFLETAVGADHA